MSRRLSLRAALVAAAFTFAVPAAANAAFTVVTSPNAFTSDSLNAVSASGPSDAWAVGFLCCSGRNFGNGTLTEHWNGSAWSIVPSPDTRFFDETLAGVADISPADAWAVGTVKQSGYKSGNPLLLHWNGTSWTSVAPPSGVSGQLLGVSASGAADVWAVGDDLHGHPLILRYNGATWSSVAPAAGTGRLRGVKAFGPKDVWTVGDGASGTLTMHWNGSAWSVVPSPNPDAFVNTLNAVGGASGSDVWAVGSKGRSEYDTGVPPGTRTLALHWNGAGWSAVSSPSKGDQNALRAVAATGPASVFAVGEWVDPSGSIPVDRTLVERFAGASWAIQASPNVTTADNLLRGAAAIPGTTGVWAVGTHLTPSGPTQTLVLRGP